jgi:repressor LexA
LTERQFRILEFIAESIRCDGFPPSIREICEFTGGTSTNGTADHIKALVRRGVLERRRSTARGLAITPAGKALLGSRAA